MRTEVCLIIWESSGLLEAGWRLRYDQSRNFPEKNSHGHLVKTATSSCLWRSAGERLAAPLGAEPGRAEGGGASAAASLSGCRGGGEERWAYLTAFPCRSASYAGFLFRPLLLGRADRFRHGDPQSQRRGESRDASAEPASQAHAAS